MDLAIESALRGQLVDRKRRIGEALAEVGEATDLVRLLQEVDSALGRMDARGYGRCEVCLETVEDDTLMANPMLQYCLCSLSPAQQRALEQDLGLASRIQWALLPKQDIRHDGWQVHFRYTPHGPVSGDYCDVITDDQHGDGGLYLLMGDVSGKGVAASLLMAHLNAMFRSLIQTRLPVPQLVERANDLFSRSAISSHYATLVCARAEPSGRIEVCNAGHCPPLVVRGTDVTAVGSTGFPLGIRSSGEYDVSHVTLAPGETLFLYTDGLTEAADSGENEFGVDRLKRFLAANAALSPGVLASACLEDLAAFRGESAPTDDLSMMVVRRTS